MSTGGHAITVYSRHGCHLCSDAEAIVARVCELHGADWTRVDVDADPNEALRYGDHVPVVVLDGRIIAYWTLSPDVLDRALRGEQVPALPDL